MRCSVGGCVLNMLSSPPAENGLMMNMCAVAGFASSGTLFDAPSSFRRAFMRPYGVPAILAPPASATKLTRSRDPRLNQHRRNRREDDGRDHRDRVRAFPVVAMAAAAKHGGELRHASEHHDGRGNGGSHRADENIPVFDVRKLVREHAFELLIVEQLHDAFGGRNRRVVRVTSRGERVGRHIGNDVHLRHGQRRLRRQSPNHVRKLMIRAQPAVPDTSSGRSCRRTSTTRSSSRSRNRTR